MIDIIEAKTPKHIDQVRLLFREYEEWLNVDLCFQDFEQELADLPGKYAAPSGCIFLAFENDRAAGCVAVRPIEHDLCEMKRLFIRPEFRNKGLGNTLVKMIIEKAKDIGYRQMRLDTLNTLEGAMHLYEKFGFKQIEPYYHNPLQGTIFWELEIDKS
jgi:GNAT superfamily N-acetyltransferase